MQEPVYILFPAELICNCVKANTACEKQQKLFRPTLKDRGWIKAKKIGYYNHK